MTVIVPHEAVVTDAKRGLAQLIAVLNASAVAALDTAYGWSLEPTGAQSTDEVRIDPDTGTPIQGIEPATIRGKGDTTDPVGNAACAVSRPMDLTYKRLLSALETLDAASRDVIALVGVCELARGKDAHARFKKEYKTALTMEPCGSIHCKDDAVIGHRHCEWCARWLEKHPGVTQPPRQVFASRESTRRAREKLRVPAENHVGEAV